MNNIHEHFMNNSSNFRRGDDIGPAAELDHWKQRMAKFNRYVLLKCTICHD